MRRRPKDGSPGRGRLAGVYATLVLLLAVVSVVVIAAGEDREPQPAVAGGYAVIDGQACLGQAIQLSQSGRFIGLGDAEEKLGGELTLEGGRLTGKVECLGDSTAELDATVEEGRLEGTLGGRPVLAELTRGPSGLTARRRGCRTRWPGSTRSRHARCASAKNSASRARACGSS